MLSCVTDRDSTTVPQTQLAEKTVKLNLIHASVDLQNSVKSEISAPFRENPNGVFSKCSRTFIELSEFRESEKSLRHELGSV